jgi:hypothetical protein
MTLRTLALMFLLACGPKAPPDLVGNWVDTETQSITSISKKGVATSVVDGDGEVYEVKASVRDGDRITYVYFVPSTGYTVTIEATPMRDGRLDVTWSNDRGASGREVWERAR